MQSHLSFIWNFWNNRWTYLIMMSCDVFFSWSSNEFHFHRNRCDANRMTFVSFKRNKHETTTACRRAIEAVAAVRFFLLFEWTRVICWVNERRENVSVSYLCGVGDLSLSVIQGSLSLYNAFISKTVELIFLFFISFVRCFVFSASLHIVFGWFFGCRVCVCVCFFR